MICFLGLFFKIISICWMCHTELETAVTRSKIVWSTQCLSCERKINLRLQIFCSWKINMFFFQLNPAFWRQYLVAKLHIWEKYPNCGLFWALRRVCITYTGNFFYMFPIRNLILQKLIKNQLTQYPFRSSNCWTHVCWLQRSQ